MIFLSASVNDMYCNMKDSSPTTHNTSFGSHNHADPKIHTIADICMAFKLRPNDNLAAILHYSGALDGVIKDINSPVPAGFLMQCFDEENFVKRAHDTDTHK